MNLFTKKQEKIYIGLVVVNAAVANLYRDAVIISKSFCQTSPPLACCVREMSNILLACLKSGRSGDRNITPEKLGISKKEFKEGRANIKSIFDSINLLKSESIAIKWARIAPQFHKYAHRKSDKYIRPFEEFRPLWEEFENVLYGLFGGYYNTIENVIDHILMVDVLDDPKVDILKKLLQKREYEQYFWGNINKIDWLPIISNKIINIREDIKCEKEYYLFWLPLNYLEKVAIQINENPDGKKKYAIELLKIIDEVVEFSYKKEREGKGPINNYHIWWFLVKILDKISIAIIKEKVSIEQFSKWMQGFANPTMHRNLAISEIIRLLLPKFLNPEMKDYAGMVLKTLTLIQPPKKKHAFIRQEDAKLVLLDRYLGDELSKHAQKIGEVCDQAVIQFLLDQLRYSLEYHTKEQYGIFKVGTKNYYRVTLNRIKSKGVDDNIIEYKEGFFSGFVQKYTDKDLTSVNPDNDYEFYQTKPNGEKWSFEINEAYDLESFQDKIEVLYTKGALKHLSLDKVNDFEKSIEYLYKGFYSDHSYIWYSALNNPKECLGASAHDILSILTTQVLLSKCATDQVIGQELIQRIVKNQKYKFPLFGRMIIYAMDRLWDKHGVLLNKGFLSAYPDLLEGSDYRVELYSLFKNHVKSFDPEVISELKRRIENPPQWYRRKSKEKDYEKILLYWQYERVTMLKATEPFKSWHDDLKKNFSNDPEPSIQSRGGFVRSVGHQSPLTKEQILQQSVSKTVNFLKEFKGAKDIGEVIEGKADKQGLADAFRSAVKDAPDKFIKEIALYDDVLLRYTVALLRGFKEAWQANKKFDWKKVLFFCQHYIEKHKNAKEDKSDNFDFSRTCHHFA